MNKTKLDTIIYRIIKYFFEQLQRSDAVGDATKQMSATLVEQTTKGKKMATWALTSRHHNSHPQLPSTRPKKALPDRGLLIV